MSHRFQMKTTATAAAPIHHRTWRNTASAAKAMSGGRYQMAAVIRRAVASFGDTGERAGLSGSSRSSDMIPKLSAAADRRRAGDGVVAMR